MNRILLILTVILSFQASSQTSEKYNSDYENFFRGEELFEKEQFGAARREFRTFIDGFDHPNDPMYIKALYYEAISALELYNTDAITLLQEFNRSYPESIYKKDIYFRLGKFYYYKKKYDDALSWFNRLSIQDIDEEDRDEFYFKVGYANFKEEKFDAARSAFFEVKDGDSQYASPALYYYSHIAYQNESYQLALEGFLKLEEDPKFSKYVPYYIAQIYYLQGKYEEVTKYVPKITTKGGVVNEKDMNLLIGDAFYRTGKYDEAVPYLEKYNASSETTREEDYRLGYAYYKSKHYDQAVRLFDRVKKIEDSLGQIAYYHIGESMLQLKNLESARSGFEGAAFIEDADPLIEEDALFNYAILSYKLDINPYGEAVEAFEMYLNKYPNSERKGDVYQYLVNVYTSTNNYSKALASLDKLPNKDVRLKEAYQLIAYNQGVDRFQKNNFSGAIASFALVKKYPINPSLSGMAIYWTADAHYRDNKFDKAIELFKKFTLLPSTGKPGLKSEAHYNIGFAHLKKANVFENKKNKLSKERELKKSREAFIVFVQSNPSSDQKKADAYMRIADSYFVTMNNIEAINFYKKALQMKAGYEDQALFYMARTYGYMENGTAEKISHLLDIVNNYKESKYLLKSVHEIAETYKSAAQYDKALTYYNIIVYDYPSSILYVGARVNVADIHFKQGKYNDAEGEYLSLLSEYGSDSEVCGLVAQGLKDLYIAINELDKLDELSSQYSCIEFSESEKENLYYIPALEVYSDSTLSDDQRYQQSIVKFELYLSEFPNGHYKNEIQNYLANCHYELGDIPTAVGIYRETLERPNSSFTEFAAIRVSHYLYNEGKYEEVIPYYKRLEQVSSDPEIIFNAKQGLMRSHYQIENWQNAAVYANKVLANGQINDDLKKEANYIKAMSNYYLKHYNDAKAAFTWIIGNTTTVMGAEARYYMSSIYYEQENFTQALSEVDGLIKMKPTYNFWVAKGLIMKARILMAQDDLFQAEQTLKSILEHYPNDNDGIIDEANELWDELMQLKDAPKDITTEGERTIEIDGEDGN